MSGQALTGDCPVVFISYSREDEKWRRRFAEMLKPLVRERRLEVWSDDRLVTGYEWRPQLAEAIGQSRAALLLVSPSFLASDFIMNQELPALMRNSVQLVPVLVRPCLWQAVSVLEGLQWGHDPWRDGAVAASADPESQIVAACVALNGLLAADSAASPLAAPALVPAGMDLAGPVVTGASLGELHDVPPPPRAAVPRQELAALREAVLAVGDGTAGVTGAVVAVHGQGGIGKTVLAAALARDEQVRRCFPDGVFWVTVGEQGDLVATQISLLNRLGAAYPQLRSAGLGAQLLRQALADRRCLLVVDDVWSVAAVMAFRVTGPRGRVLYTTRDPAVLDGSVQKVIRLGALPSEAVRELLRRMAGVRELPAEADRIVTATGGVALAVALVGAAVGAGGRDWAEAAAQLEAAGRTFLDHPYANIFKAMQVGVAALEEADAAAYRALAVYPEDTVVPVAAIIRLWSHVARASAEDTAARLAKLAARGLLTAHRAGVSFHDLQRQFLLLHTDDLPLGHADLLAAYRALLPSGGSWARLPPDEPYIRDHLMFHLRGAGDGATVQVVACDLAWVAARSFADGPYAVESDLRQAAALFPNHAGIGWLLRLISQWSHLLTGHPTIGDLAVTLASRTQDAPASIDAGTLAALLPSCYLTPEWGLPSAQLSLVRVMEGHTNGVDAVAFSPDGRWLASAAGRSIQLWDSVTGQPVAVWDGDADWVEAVEFSPDGRLLASSGSGGTVRLWDPATCQPVAVWDGDCDWVGGALAFSPDGRLLARGGSGGLSDDRLRLWNLATGQAHAMADYVGPVQAVAFSPDGRLLVCGDGAMVRLWEVATGQPAAILRSHASTVQAVAFCPDGRLLASASDDGTVRLWDIATGQPAAILDGHTSTVQAVAFSPDGSLLASGGGDMSVRLWDMATSQPAASDCRADLIHAVAFSPDGRVLASGDYDGTVRLWDPVTGQPVAVWNSDTYWVHAVAFSPDGRLLASGGSGDRPVRLWDVATGRPAATIDGHRGPIRAVAFSPDGCVLASGDSGWVRLWEAATGQTATLALYTDWLEAVAFSPDGRLLASGGGGDDDGSMLRLWDVATGQLAGTLDGHTSRVFAVAFSPDGRLLASGSSDTTVRLWDVATGQLAGTLNGHTRLVWAVAFSPDGRLLASGSEDGTVRLWDARTLTPVSQLKVGVPVKALAWVSKGLAVAAHQSIIQLTVTDHTDHRPDS